MIIEEMFIEPRRIVIHNASQIKQYVEMYNGKKHLYKTVYNYVDIPSQDHALVDKIFLDFDAHEKNFFEDVRTVAKYLYEQNIVFYIRFSGRGFHIYIELVPAWVRSPKRAIKNFVRDLHKETGTKSDPAVVGDLRRVARMINTLNLKSNRYCISISYKTLMEKTYEEIFNLAITKGSTKDYINGENQLDISPWDQEARIVQSQKIISKTIKLSHEFPPCIKEMMKDPFLAYRERFYVIIFLRELGYTREEIENILQSFLDTEWYEHCIHEENILKYLVDNEKYIFADCTTLQDEGRCMDYDCDGPGLYY